MRSAPRRLPRDAGQGLAKVLTLSIAGAAGTAYLVLRSAGLLPSLPEVRGWGTPLNAKPYFAHSSAASPTFASLPQVSTDPAVQSAVVNADKALLPEQQKRATVSARSYLQALEHTEDAKQALLKTILIRSPRLRADLIQADPSAARASALTPDTGVGAPELLPGSEDSEQSAWDRLLSDFEQQTPPYNCVELYASYSAHLKALRDYILTCRQGDTKRASDQVTTGESSPAVSEKQQAQANLRVETSVAKEALEDLCARYGLAPEVEITVAVR